MKTLATLALAISLSCLASCPHSGGGGGSSGANAPPNGFDFSGGWTGHWSKSDGTSGPAALQIVQHAWDISGTMNLGTYPCQPMNIAGHSEPNAHIEFTGTTVGCGIYISVGGYPTAGGGGLLLNFVVDPNFQQQGYLHLARIPFAPPIEPPQESLTVERVRDADPRVDVYTLRRK